MLKSGNGLFLEYGEEITCIYGEASSGKTTLAKLAAIVTAEENKKVVYIDTENGFNLERLKQLSTGDFERVLDNILLFKPKRFSEQNKLIRSLPEMKKISLIILDTIGKYYRVKVREKPQVYNFHAINQLRILKGLSKKIPVIITNQVYRDLESGRLEMIGGRRFKIWCGKVYKLEKNPRKLVFESPKSKEVNFEIVEEGIKKI